LKERERRKEEEVEALKCSMQAGLVRLICISFVSLDLSLKRQLNTIMFMKGFATRLRSCSSIKWICLRNSYYNVMHYFAQKRILTTYNGM